MKRMTRVSLFAALLASATIPGVTVAQGGNYFLDSRNPDNGFQVLLGAGRWSVGVTAGGWSPWNYLERCDFAGANCHTGFHTIFCYMLGNGPVTSWGVDGRTFETSSTSDFYASSTLAFQHVLSPFIVNVAQSTLLHAFIPDDRFVDNTGGLTVTVASVTPQAIVPEPVTFGLVAVGLLAVGLAARRTRRAI